MAHEKICLSELSSELKAAGYIAPKYATLYRAVLDGRLSDVMERDNGRWYVARSGVALVASTLGIPKKESAAA